MNHNDSISSFLGSSDPLSDQAINFLLQYREENDLVDFKETFNTDSEKEWLELTKDITAFANTSGGYLVFGIRDKTYDHIGVEESVSLGLADTNKLMQKINRFIEPDIANIRSKQFIKDDKYYIGILIPESIGSVHMISKDALFKFESGEKKIMLHLGTFYVRRSGCNHLADPRDLELVINKRIERFKESILGKIARVIEAPRESEVFIVSADPTGDPKHTFRIDNAPDSIPVKGMTFTVSPQTPEQEVAAWGALWKGDPSAIPHPAILWRWYEQRHSLKLTEEQKLLVAEFSLLAGIPSFFWLLGISEEKIKSILKDAITRQISIDWCATRLHER